jgi:hypothetical protein
MTKIGDQAAEPAIITVAELISELSRCPGKAASTFGDRRRSKS